MPILRCNIQSAHFKENKNDLTDLIANNGDHNVMWALFSQLFYPEFECLDRFLRTERAERRQGGWEGKGGKKRERERKKERKRERERERKKERKNEREISREEGRKKEKRYPPLM